MEPKNRVTLADVAAAAGVSKMTASRALRGAQDVSQRNIDKVQQAARDIGYLGNHLAMALSSNRSNLIGVLVPSLNNIVFAEVLSGIAEGIAGSGLQPVFGVTDYDPDREYDLIKNLLSWNPTGLIVTGTDQSDLARGLLAATPVPVIQIMDTDGEAVGAVVGFSHVEAGRDMARALVGQGRRRIGYVGCGLDRDTRARKRKAGFIAGLAEAGLTLAETCETEALSSVQAGAALTADLLTRSPDLDCIYFSNDDVAAGGMFYCIAQGIDVQSRILLAGFNGLDLARSLPFPIATTLTPRHDIGVRAARALIAWQKADETADPQREVLDTRLSLPGSR